MKRIILLVGFIALSTRIYCQAPVADTTGFDKAPTSINEVVKQLSTDTLLFYYNDRWQLVKPICATKFRISCVDTIQMAFKGKFVDYYYADSTKAIEGSYSNGKKEGLFNLYFPNGQLEQTGCYVNNKKQGIWEYFYDTGLKRHVLNFTENEILVVDYWDEDGKQQVTSGNGKWLGYLDAEKFSRITGDVLNGRKEGIWKKAISFRHQVLNVEKYKDGKLLSGKLISMMGGAESYKDSSYCLVDQKSTFVAAESFQVNRCYSLPKNKWVYASFPGGMDRFYSEIKEKLVISSTYFSRGTIRIHTTIDENGTMTNFKAISDIGLENELIQVLQTMGNWYPTKLNGKPIKQPKIIYLNVL